MFNILKYLREEQSLSQDDLASALGLSRQTISKYENGETNFTLDIIKKLSQFFDVDYSCFIDNKPPVRPEYNIIEGKKATEEQEIRIDIPQENISKFKQNLPPIL